MALFKIFRGRVEDLPKTFTDGYCYFTVDTGMFYIDYAESENSPIQRIVLNANDAKTILGKTVVEDMSENIADIPTSGAVQQAIDKSLQQYIEIDGGAIDTLKEIAAWIVNDEAGTAKIIADIKNNSDMIQEQLVINNNIEERVKNLEDTSLNEITTSENSGLKITNKNQIDMDDEIVFILDCGTATTSLGDSTVQLKENESGGQTAIIN